MLDYRKELLSVQCEQALATIGRLKKMEDLSPEDRQYLDLVAPTLTATKDRFRVTRVCVTSEPQGETTKEAEDGR